MGYNDAQPSNEVHSAQRPVGIGGWLVLPLLQVLTAPFISGYAIYTMITEWNLFNGHIGGPDARYDYLRLPLLATTLTEVINIGIAVFCLYLMLTRSPKTPKWMTIFYLGGLLISLVDLYIYWLLDAAGFDGWSDGVTEVGSAAVTALIWVTYFRRSRRVANTFRARTAEIEKRLSETFS